MNGWWILTIVLAIITLGFIIFTEIRKKTWQYILSFVLIGTLMFFGIKAAMNPIIARTEIISFESTKYSVIISDSVLDDALFVDEVNKANEWLSKAKESYKKYGAFSKYYGTNIMDIDFIEVKK